ncbi:unnamed protein product [Mytilus edulis]|uniref:DUF6451 domain-containing protein n=1 Tax=Mytilus edulis TaxID=6550 RepID=A0A8S3UCX5_MYTED|nr:unnamed protein product [Mytilus edulis]
MQEKTDRLSHFASQIGLELNAKKTQEMRLYTTSNLRLKAKVTEIQQVDKFSYLGTVVSTEDIQRLPLIWKSKQYNRKTKIRLYNINVKSVLLYGSECWRVTKIYMRSLSSFHDNCLRRICKIVWPYGISNEHLLEMTKSMCILKEIRQRRFRWMGACSQDACIQYHQDSS